MSSLTGKILNLIKPAVTDSVLQTIADLASNFQAIDDGHSAHLAETATEEGGVHGIEIERGTFTPVLSGTITHGAPAYVFQCGTYYKVGKLISCNILLQISDKGEMEGFLIIYGLPFVAGGSLLGVDNRYSASIGDHSGVTPQVIGGWLPGGQNAISFSKMSVDDSARRMSAEEDISDFFEIQISIVYETI